jgi:hypothetical protein
MRGLVLVLCIFATALDWPTYPIAAAEICPGALVFYRQGTPRPAGTRAMRVACVIGHHVFLAPDPRSTSTHPKAPNHGSKPTTHP